MPVVTGPDNHKDEQFVQLVALYERQLLRMCYVYLHDTGLAEDAVQECFLKAYRSMDSFRGDSSEKTWLMRIAINTCKDMRRTAWFKLHTRSVRLEDLPDTALPVSPEDSLLTLEIMRLPQKLMEVVLLYYYQGMTVYEIAELLGISAPSVSTRLQKARRRLHNALKGEPTDE